MRVRVLQHEKVNDYKIQIKSSIFSNWRDANIRIYNSVTDEYYEDVLTFNSWNKAFKMAYEIYCRKTSGKNKSSTDSWRLVIEI